MKFKDLIYHRILEVEQHEDIPSLLKIIIYDEVLKSLSVEFVVNIQDLQDYLNSLDYAGKE